MVKSYTPKRGDIVWTDFSPVRGHEQAGRRPALIISHGEYNKLLGLCLVCPITTKIKDYPFEVSCFGEKVQGVVLVDQIRALDWRDRPCIFAERVDAVTFAQVTQLLQHLIL